MVPTSSPAAPPVDLPKLREWVPEDAAWARLVHVYVKESRRALKEIRAGVVAHDPERVRTITHSWKVSNAWLGSHALVELCKEIEAFGTQELLERGERHVERMTHAFDAVKHLILRDVRQSTTEHAAGDAEPTQAIPSNAAQGS